MESRREQEQQAIRDAYSSLDEIDQKCKLIWPDWCPPPPSPPRPKPVREEPPKEPPPTDPIPTGSPKPAPKKRRAEQSKCDPKSTEYILCEVDDLKDEVQDLMKRISDTVKSPTKTQSPTETPQSPGDTVEEIQPEVMTEEIVLEEPHPVDVPLSVDFQIEPQPVRTKGQLKSAIAFTQKQIKEIQEENRDLVKQILSLRQKYKAAKERVDKLQRTITRSEMVQKKAFAAKCGKRILS